MIARRNLVTALGCLAFPAVAGCADFPPHRELSIGAISAHPTDSGWKLELSVVNANTIRTEKATFHDVTVYAYSEQGTVVGKRAIGDLSYEHNTNKGKEVTVDCQGFPYVVTFDAKASPCAENISIMMAVYDRKNDGAYIWRTEFRECGEGLPPSF